MKVWVIENGGSVIDTLATFATRELAEETLAVWQQHMGVHDDGWTIEEWDVFERPPTRRVHWKAYAWVEADGTVSKRWTTTEVFFEWEGDRKPYPTQPFSWRGVNSYHKTEQFTIGACSDVSLQAAEALRDRRIEVLQRFICKKYNYTVSYVGRQIEKIREGELVEP